MHEYRQEPLRNSCGLCKTLSAYYERGQKLACCSHCQLSLNTLKQMKENQTEFYTAAGRNKLWIAEVDENAQTIRMKRSTGKITWTLDYQKLKEIHDLVHRGEISLDQYEIDKVIPTWGNYITGLLRHLGCRKI